jgi:NADPH2:quinone reductase
MDVLAVDPAAPARLRHTTASDPVPGPGEVLVRVTAAGVNPGELHGLEDAEAGTVPGWEAAGVVVGAAPDGSGPAPGTRVVTAGWSGGWAGLRAVPVTAVGTVPDGVADTEAATLPIAAGSALRALRDLGPVLGRRIVVTGATGAVGRFAVQLAALGGADVVATARDGAAAGELHELGAREVLPGPDAVHGTVDGVVDTVGGPGLVAAFGALAPGGTVVSVGRASRSDAVFPPDALLGDGTRHGRSLRTFFLYDGRPGLGRGLAWLARLVAERRLHTRVDHVVPFTEAPAALDAGLPGRAVLVPGGPDGPDVAR